MKAFLLPSLFKYIRLKQPSTDFTLQLYTAKKSKQILISRFCSIHRRHHPRKPYLTAAHHWHLDSRHVGRLRAGGLSRSRPALRPHQHRVVPGPQRSRHGVRIQRDETRSHLTDVRAKLVLFSSERDFFDFKKRVHGLGETEPESVECARRDFGCAK